MNSVSAVDVRADHCIRSCAAGEVLDGREGCQAGGRAGLQVDGHCRSIAAIVEGVCARAAGHLLKGAKRLPIHAAHVGGGDGKGTACSTPLDGIHRRAAAHRFHPTERCQAAGRAVLHIKGHSRAVARVVERIDTRAAV